MRVRLGNDCINCKICVGTCPEVFKVNPSNYRVEVEFVENLEQYADAVKKAAESCPAKNIIVAE